MENNTYTLEQFNQLFFSQISMSYLFVNLVLILSGLIASEFILEAHPPKPNVNNREEEERELQPLEDDNPISDDSEIKEERHRRGLASIGKQEAYLDHIKDIRFAENRYTVFKNPKWRLLPLLVFPYTACFSTSLIMTFTRCLTNSTESELSGFVSKVYLLIIVS